MPPGYRCWAEVDLDALRENLAWIRHRVGPGIKIMTVVKADAYGHGLRQIAALLMQSGTDVFGVANLGEAAAIRSVGQGWPVLMLGACLPEESERALRDRIMITISSRAEAERVSEQAGGLGLEAPVHVKVDTGMGRLGVAPDQAVGLIDRMRRLPRLRLSGLFTHYAAVEDDPTFSRRQRRIFADLVREFQARGVVFDYVHVNNTGGLLFEPDAVHNTVRPGLAVYGVVPEGRRLLRSRLAREIRPALEWKCRVTYVKSLPAGATISYGRTFRARRRLRVATLSAGYGDGYLRSASNRAFVLVGGRRCRILGRITMDQMVVDATRVSRVTAGDEAVLIGRQGRQAIAANAVAAWAGTIPWEVLTAIAYRVPRLYRGGQAA
jgi:alanine racemase